MTNASTTPGWRTRGIIAGLLAVCYLLIHFLIGFEYERHDGIYSMALQGGFWTDQPETDIFIYYTFLSYVYSGLVHLIDMDWFALFMILYNWIAVTLIIDALYLGLRKKGVGNWAAIGLLVLLTIVIAFENIIQIQSLRTPFLMTIAIFLQLFVRMEIAGKVSFSKLYPWLLFSAVFFAIAFWTKYEGSMLIYGMTAALTILFFKPWRMVGNVLVKIMVPFGAFVFLLFFVTINRNATTQYGWTFLRNAYTYEDAVYIIKPELQNERDSILQEVFDAGFRCDREQIDEKYFNDRTVKPIGLLEFFYTRNVLLEYAKLVKEGFSNRFHWSKMLFNGLLLVLCLVMYWRSTERDRAHWIRYVLFHVGFWFGFFTLDFLITRPVHIESPVYLWYSCFHLLFAAPYLEKFFRDRKEQYVIYGFIVLTLIAVIYESVKTRSILAEYEAYEQFVQPVRAEINEKFKGKTVVLSVAASQYFIRKPFQRIGIDPDIRIMTYDGLVSLFGFYEEYLKRTVGSADFDAFYAYLYGQKEDVVFMAPPKRMEMFSRYLSIIYGKEYQFELLYEPGTTELSKTSKLEYQVFKPVKD